MSEGGGCTSTLSGAREAGSLVQGWRSRANEPERAENIVAHKYDGPAAVYTERPEEVLSGGKNLEQGQRF